MGAVVSITRRSAFGLGASLGLMAGGTSIARGQSNLQIPALLGQGINSVGLKTKGYAVARSNIVPNFIGVDTTELHYVDSYNSLYSFLDVSAQMAFSGFSGQASVAASYSQTIRLSDLNAYL